MATDIVPKSIRNQKTWLTGLKVGITNDGPTCGRSAPQVTADTAFIDTLLTPVTDADDKAMAALEAEGLSRFTMRENNDTLRSLIKNYKSSPGWNEGMAAAWDVLSETVEYDMNTHQPTVSVKTVGGQVAVGGRKPGFGAVDVMMRVTGTATWTKIAGKVMHLPVIDSTAPQTPGKPESRDYQFIGYVGDQPAGQPSDIVTNIFPG
jgi:hypothetical protein